MKGHGKEKCGVLPHKLMFNILDSHCGHYKEPGSQLKENGLFERIFRLHLQGRSSLWFVTCIRADFLAYVFFDNEDGNMLFRNVG
jgi:hypothetical protein